MVILVGGFSLLVCLWLYLWLPILGCSAERISALHGQRAVKRTTKCCNLQRLVLADQNIPGLLSLGTITYYYRILPQSTRIILMIFTPVLPRRISPCWVTGPRWLRAFCVTIECSGTPMGGFPASGPMWNGASDRLGHLEIADGAVGLLDRRLDRRLNQFKNNNRFSNHVIIQIHVGFDCVFFVCFKNHIFLGWWTFIDLRFCHGISPFQPCVNHLTKWDMVFIAKC